MPAVETFMEQLRGFVPPRVFDAHAHLYQEEDFVQVSDQVHPDFPRLGSYDAWHRRTHQQLGGACDLTGGLFFADPRKDADAEKLNQWAIEQVQRRPNSRALIVVTPDCDPDRTAAYFADTQIVGFKPYWVYSKEPDPYRSSIGGFLPDWAWQLADRHRAVIMLHLVKDLALADPENLREIRTHCEKYPDAQLVLAHGGRCFHGPHARAAVAAYRGLDNLWFDTSAVCEPEPLIAILDEFGPQRLMWGSDFPVSAMLGKCVTLGDGFFWIYPERIPSQSSSYSQLFPVGLESLRAIRQACDNCGLNKQDLEDIFFTNAMRLLGIAVE
jgi:glutamate-1-semialdehyde 2,1-aminomutase